MRFAVDECTGPAVSDWLRSLDHDVFSVFEGFTGISDDKVLEIANREDRIIITNDKDFGLKIYREHKQHKGVIFLRLSDERAPNKIHVIHNVLNQYPDQIQN